MTWRRADLRPGHRRADLAADRAGRTGAPTQAAASYANAARLAQVGAPDGQQAAALLWEHDAEAALTNADYADAVERAGQAADAYRLGNDTRSAACAQAIARQARWSCPFGYFRGVALLMGAETGPSAPPTPAR